MGHILIELSSQIHYFLEADKATFWNFESSGSENGKLDLLLQPYLSLLQQPIAITLHKELDEERKSDTLRLQARARVRTSERHHILTQQLIVNLSSRYL